MVKMNKSVELLSAWISLKYKTLNEKNKRKNDVHGIISLLYILKHNKRSCVVYGGHMQEKYKNEHGNISPQLQDIREVGLSLHLKSFVSFTKESSLANRHNVNI